MADDLFALAHALSREGEPFALATVVRCDRPTSAKPGAKALVRSDGTVRGWVGGSCAEPVVVRESLRAMQDGRPRLVALVGEGAGDAGRRDGVVEYPMTCHSGGTLEIFVEPVLPKPALILVGGGPVADSLAALGTAAGYSVAQVRQDARADRPPELRVPARAFVVVITHGAFDEDALEQALMSDAGYVSLVASRRRAAAVSDALRARGMPADRLRRLKAPAGLDIGAATPDEIAVSILAEIVQVSRRGAADPGPAEGAAARGADVSPATDPVCGMIVDTRTVRHRSEVAGKVFFFCCAHCKRTFDQAPAHYAGSVSG